MKMETNAIKEIKNRLGGKLRENHPLAVYTTWKVGGKADFYFPAESLDELIKAVSLAYEHKLPIFILGRGSNVLVSDDGFRGLVIHNSTNNISFLTNESQVLVDSGVTLPRLAAAAASRDFSGLEALAGIPGSLGGAIIGNAGAFGQSINQLIKNLTVLEYGQQRIKIINRDVGWLESDYRQTKIKKMVSQKRPIILSVRLQLRRGKKEEILLKTREFQQRRLTNQPIGEKTAGCVFKNLGIEKEKTAGYLLAQAGAKKLKIGGAAVSSKHGNFIINKGRATANDIYQLINKMRQLVLEKFSVNLMEEIEYVGYFNNKN